MGHSLGVFVSNRALIISLAASRACWIARLQRNIRLGGSRKVQLHVDMFNPSNSAIITGRYAYQNPAHDAGATPVLLLNADTNSPSDRDDCRAGCDVRASAIGNSPGRATIAAGRTWCGPDRARWRSGTWAELSSTAAAIGRRRCDCQRQRSLRGELRRVPWHRSAWRTTGRTESPAVANPVERQSRRARDADCAGWPSQSACRHATDAAVSVSG